MNKKRIFNLLKFSPICGIFAPLVISASCVGEKEDLTRYEITKELDPSQASKKYYQKMPIELEAKVEEIFKNINFPEVFKLKDGIDQNDYYIDINDFENRAILVSGKYLVQLSTVSLVDPLSKTSSISEVNNKWKTQRKLEFKFFIKERDGKFASILGWSKSIFQNVDLNLNLPSNIPTTLNKEIMKPIGINWDQIAPHLYFDAEIVHWKDGDTFDVKPIWVPENSTRTDIIKNIENKDVITIRFKDIDTPEKAVGSVASSAQEYQFALLSSKFGTDNFAEGSRIRIWSEEGNDAYGRAVGAVWFQLPGSDDWYNYGVEIVRHGLSLPYAKSAELVQTLFETDILNRQKHGAYWTFYEIATALKDARENRRGFFSLFRKEVGVSANVYIIKTNNNYGVFLENSTEKPNVFQNKEKLYHNN